MTSKKDIADLFNTEEAQDLGIDSQSASLVVANLNATNLPMCVGAPIEELESDDVIVIMFAIDCSGSMSGVADILIQEFNETLIEGLRGASKASANAVVVGGLKFDGVIEPLWGGGFKKLEDLPLLTDTDYFTRGSTNLYQAQMDAITAATAYATQVLQDTGTPPKTIIVVLSDGADNHQAFSPADIKKVVDGLSRELVVPAFVGFETFERVNFADIASQTGFTEVMEIKMKKGETRDDVRRRFRHMIGVLSSSVIRQSQTAVDPSGGFWQGATK